MKRNADKIGLALAALALVGLAAPVGAQQAPQDLVPFTATLTGPVPTIVTLPLEPPMLTANLPLTGQTNLMGQVSYIDQHSARMGVDGVIKSGNGVAVITAANGDALFITWSGLFHPTATGVTGDQAFIVIGGRGRFLGATGSGALTENIDFVKNAITFTWDGMVSRPKP